MSENKNAKPTTNNPKRFTCRHIFHDGHRCGSPALRGDRTFCYYHRSTPRPNPPLPSTDPEVKFAGPSFAELLLPLPEDRAAIQTCIGMVMRAIGSARIDIRRANALLYSLQLASLNLPPHPRVPQVSVSQASNLRPGNTSSSSQSATSNPQPPTPVVDEVEDSDLGPLAPILEYGLPEPEEECEPSLASIINTYLNSPPPPPPVELEKRPYDVETLQLLRRTLATTTNPETAARIRKALEEEALIPGHNLHIQACAEQPGTYAPLSKSVISTEAVQLHRTAQRRDPRISPSPLQVPVPQVSNLRPVNTTAPLPDPIPNPIPDPIPDSPAHLHHRCRAVRRAFLPRSARPLPPNLPIPTPRPPVGKERSTTLPTLRAVADRLPHPHVRPKVLGLPPMFSSTYRKTPGGPHGLRITQNRQPITGTQTRIPPPRPNRHGLAVSRSTASREDR